VRQRRCWVERTSSRPCTDKPGRPNVDESQFTRIEAIINSMTSKERHNSAIINGSRRKRIALGSGTTVQEVNNLLRQHTQMSKLFKGMGSMAGGGAMKAQQRLLSQMQGKQRFGR
jgi:signal recognition particle subunit SRP54